MYFNSNGMPSIVKVIVGYEPLEALMAPKLLINVRSTGKTLVRAVKLTTAFILIACLQVSARTNAQRLSISVKNVTLEKLFSEIEKKTNYVFFYDVTILKGAQPVTIDVKDASVEEILVSSLNGQALAFTIHDRTIFVKQAAMEKNVTSKELNSTAGIPDIKLRGIVYNEAGQPLAGANVTVEETGHGTITNAKGEFQLVVQLNNTLRISFIGYAPQRSKVKDASEIRINLNVAKDELDKVVIQPYGTTTQRLATGDIATVTAAEIERQPVMNPLEALFGKVPGLVVTQTNGYASAPVNVQIRGLANANAVPSDPLFIIDGVPVFLNGTGASDGSGIILKTPDNHAIFGPAAGQSPLFSLNPSDIESITVLKDADATAIYGSRGANGVIVITTKKGKPGKTHWDVNVYQGINLVTGHYDLLNTKQYLAMRMEALKNDGILPTQGNAYDLLTWDTTRYTDYQKFFWGGTGKTIDAQTGISGGDKQTNFRISGGYHRQTPMFTYSGAEQRGSLQFNITHKSLDQRLLLSFSNYYGFTQSDLISLGGSVTIAPNSPLIFDLAHHLNFAGWAPITYRYGNLLQPYQSKTGSLNSSLNVRFELVRGLTVGLQAAYAATNADQFSLTPIISQDPTSNPLGSSSFANSDGRTNSIEPQIEYKGTIGRGKIDALVGASRQSMSSNIIYSQGSGYTDDNLLHSIGSAPIKFSSNGASEYNYAAIFGRLNYNWEDKYILNLSTRRDGSSRFGPGNQFGNFWSVGGAWIFTEETWIKDHLSFLSFGKLRGSYGLTGSDQIPNYQYLTQWSGSQVLPYNGSSTYVPIQHANPLLHWQTNKKLETALNLGFLQDRLDLGLAWYRNRCGDQLVSYPLPYLTGFPNVTANLPATVQNEGIEANLSAKLINKSNLSWTLNFNIGRNWNQLVAFPGLSQSPFASSYVIGQPLSIAYVLHYTGIDPQTGLYTFLDKNKDGVITASYNQGVNDFFIRDLTVRVDGGIGTDLVYKGWQFNLFFNFRKQELPSAVSGGFPGTIGNNQSTQILDHWQKPGDKAKYARYTTKPTDSDYNFWGYSDGKYSDGSYIRLKNVSVSYELPERWTKKANFQKCLIYLRGQNLFILTRYNGLDPDVPSLGALPPAKHFTAGIQFTL